MSTDIASYGYMAELSVPLTEDTGGPSYDAL